MHEDSSLLHDSPARTASPSIKPGSKALLKVLYIACPSFSGSTLLSFLLNTHRQMFTVGHTTGWKYAPEDDFRCSCGEKLESCRFFAHVAAIFEENRLPFNFWNFGTDYRVSDNEKFNRYLTAQLPFVQSSTVENLRDFLVRLNPVWSTVLARQGRANRTFMSTALAYSDASVYVDNSHSPFRLRHLNRIPDIELAVVHLVRDIRGVVYSHMKNHDWDVDSAIKIWFREQASTVRILREFERVTTVHYEDLCNDTDETLAGIHRFAGLAPQSFPGSFTNGEHHILGNAMRMRDSTVSLDQRWQSELSAHDQNRIEEKAAAFAGEHANHPLSEILRHYLDGA